MKNNKAPAERLAEAVAEGLAEALNGPEFSAKGVFSPVPTSYGPDGVYLVRPSGASSIHVFRLYTEHDMASSMDIWVWGSNGHAFYFHDHKGKVIVELDDPQFFTNLARGVEEWHKFWVSKNLRSTSARA